MKIYCQSGINLKALQTQGTDSKILNTGRHCFFPKDKWTDVILESTIANGIKNPYLLFFKVDEESCKEFQEKVLSLPEETLSRDTLNQFSSNILSTNSVIDFRAFRSIDLNITPSHQKSTAYNYQLEEYLGLHIDTHDEILNSQRSNAWSIITINLGKSERYFNFIDIDFDTICTKLDFELGHSIDFDKVKMPELIRLFFLAFPNYPIYRVVLPPGHGYVACTQNFIHDGATNTNHNDDFNILISGEFKISANENLLLEYVIKSK